MTLTLDARPRPASGVVPTPEPEADGSLTLVSPHGEVLELNATAAALFELCDGTTSVREIVAAATSLFDGPPDSITREICAILDRLVGAGLLDDPEA